MKTIQLLITIVIVFVLLATASNAQTPYDSFAPNLKSKRILDSPHASFKVINTDTSSEVKYVEFDSKKCTLTYYDTNKTIIRIVQLQPSDLKTFTSTDPLWEKYRGWSPYSYSGNNPLRIKDPSGLDWFYHEKEGEKNKSWNWHEGSKYKGMTGYSHLVRYTITGTNDKGASIGTLQVFNQNKLVTQTQNVVSGGAGSKPIDLGTYMMRIGNPGDNFFLGNQNVATNGTHLSTVYGLQYLGTHLNPSGTNDWVESGVWGEGRVRLTQVNQSTLRATSEADRGVFLHSDYTNRRTSHGCVSEPINLSSSVGNNVFDYFWNGGNPPVVGKVPFVVEKK